MALPALAGIGKGLMGATKGLMGGGAKQGGKDMAAATYSNLEVQPFILKEITR